ALFLAHRLPVLPIRHGDRRQDRGRARARPRDLPRKDRRARRPPTDRRDQRREDAGLPLPDLPRRRIRGGGARGLPAVRVARLLMYNLAFDVAHLLAGTMLVLSFLLLYQDRVTAVLNVFALQAIALALSVAWQSLAQDAPHLIVTALVALVVKGF